ncbi:hypothetical protein C8R45DRAFT_1223078 [Mycena sanguinolenta]|nr:hypothetical protein C8R45DRAFT_1223078 [Mycena sanguinolenta]
MSTPLQKPLLLPGIAPHLFQSRRADKTAKTTSSLSDLRLSTMPVDTPASAHNKQSSDSSMNSDIAGMLIPISDVVHSGAPLLLARRTAEARVDAQANEIAVLRANVASLSALAQSTTTLYHDTQKKLMAATFHLNTIIAIYGETGSDHGLEAALIAARDFMNELIGRSS